jgi:hypothetical protein
MKKVTVFFVFAFFSKTFVLGQNIEFDSVKVYTETYYGTGPHLNQYNVMYSGDSVLITDNNIAVQFYNKLYAMKKKSTLSNLKKIRNDFTAEGMNVRAVFVFYKKTEKTFIGISPQLLMFINSRVFEKKDIKLEDMVKPCVELYKNLFPTREEIINGN